MGLHWKLDPEDRDWLGFAEEYMRVRVLPERPIVCPAGTGVGEATCLCRVDGKEVPARLQPKTYYGRCTTVGYEGCPTWRADVRTHHPSYEEAA
jgi:hypothetical protein